MYTHLHIPKGKKNEFLVKILSSSHRLKKKVGWGDSESDLLFTQCWNGAKLEIKLMFIGSNFHGLSV